MSALEQATREEHNGKIYRGSTHRFLAMVGPLSRQARELFTQIAAVEAKLLSRPHGPFEDPFYGVSGTLNAMHEILHPKLSLSQADRKDFMDWLKQTRMTLESIEGRIDSAIEAPSEKAETPAAKED